MSSAYYSWIFPILVSLIFAQSTLAFPNARITPQSDYLKNWEVIVKNNTSPDCSFPPKDIFIDDLNQSNDTTRLLASIGICDEAKAKGLCEYLILLPLRICNKNFISKPSHLNKNLTSTDIITSQVDETKNICNQIQILDSNFNKVEPLESCNDICIDSSIPLCRLVLYGVKLLEEVIKNSNTTDTDAQNIPKISSLLSEEKIVENVHDVKVSDVSQKIESDKNDNEIAKSVSSLLQAKKHITSFSKSKARVPISQNNLNRLNENQVPSTDTEMNGIKLNQLNLNQLADQEPSPLSSKEILKSSSPNSTNLQNQEQNPNNAGQKSPEKPKEGVTNKDPIAISDIDKMKNISQPLYNGIDEGAPNKEMNFADPIPSEPAEDEIDKMIPDINEGIDGPLKPVDADDEKLPEIDEIKFTDEKDKKNGNSEKMRLKEYERTRNLNEIGTDHFTVSDLNVEETNYLNYLIAFIGIVGILYLAFHNKKRLIAYLIEGKRPRNSRSRRSSSSSYRKLENNFD